MPSLSQKIAFNAFISAGARVINSALALVIIAFVTRYLGPATFGDYVVILAYLAIFTVLADFGLYSITIREISRPFAQESMIASQAFSLRLTLGLVVFGLGSILVWFLPYSEATKFGLIIGAIGFWFFSNSQVLVGIFQKYLRMDKIAIGETIGRLFQLILVFIFIQRDLGFLSIIVALSVSALINFALIFYFTQRYVKVKLAIDLAYWKKLAKQSFPLAVSALLVLVYFRFNTIFLSFLRPSEDVGIFGVAFKVLEALIFFPAMIAGLAMPILSNSAASDKMRFSRVSQRTFDLLAILAIPLVVGTLIFSPEIIWLIGGKEFVPASGVLNILIFAVAVIFFGALFSIMLIALGKQKDLAKIYAVGALVSLATNPPFIYYWSYYGAAFSSLLVELIVTVLMLAVIYKEQKFIPALRVFSKVVIASLLMASVFLILKSFSLVASAFLGGAFYFIILYLIGGITKGDLELLVKKS